MLLPISKGDSRRAELRVFDRGQAPGYNHCACLRQARVISEVFSVARRKSQRRDWRMVLFLAISIVMVVSMVLFTVIPAFTK